MLGGYSKIIDIAKELGFSGIAPRAGQGNSDGSFSKSLDMKDVRRIVDSGLDCLPWEFSRPAAIKAEIANAVECQDAGATAYIIDAELPWDQASNAKDRAKEMGELLMPLMRIPVYDAPWPWIDWHPGYPEKEFRWVDGRLIQAYWTEIGVSARLCLDRAREQWSKRDSRVYPIGVTYGQKEIKKWGAAQVPPGEISVDTVKAVAHEITGGWYSMEAAGTGVLDALGSILKADRPTPVPVTPCEADEPPDTLPESCSPEVAEWRSHRDAALEAMSIFSDSIGGLFG